MPVGQPFEAPYSTLFSGSTSQNNQFRHFQKHISFMVGIRSLPCVQKYILAVPKISTSSSTSWSKILSELVNYNVVIGVVRMKW